MYVYYIGYDTNVQMVYIVLKPASCIDINLYIIIKRMQ